MSTNKDIIQALTTMFNELKSKSTEDFEKLRADMFNVKTELETTRGELASARNDVKSLHAKLDLFQNLNPEARANIATDGGNEKRTNQRSQASSRHCS